VATPCGDQACAARSAGGNGPDLLLKTLGRFSKGFFTRDLRDGIDVAG
jgi:hypothetical protein